MGKKISIDLEAGTAQFISGMEKSAAALDNVDDHAKSAKGMVSSFMEGLGIGTGIEVAEKGLELLSEGLEKLKQGFEETAEMGRGATRLGINVEDYSRLKYAADVTHTSIETVEGSMEKMLLAIDKGAEGDKKLSLMFQKLGLDAANLRNENPAQAFEQMSSAIAHVGNAAERMEDVRELFGKAGAAVLPMIENLRSLEAESDKMGFTRTAEDVQRVTEAEEEWAKVTKQVETAFMDLAVAATPAIKAIGGELRVVLEDAKNFVDWVSHADLRHLNSEVQQIIDLEKQRAQLDSDMDKQADSTAQLHAHEAYLEILKKELELSERAQRDRIAAGGSDKDVMADMANSKALREMTQQEQAIVAGLSKREEASKKADEAQQKDQERRERELEHIRSWTKDPALAKYEKRVKELIDVRAGGLIDQPEYFRELQTMRSELAAELEREHPDERDKTVQAVSRRFSFDVDSNKRQHPNAQTDMSKTQTELMKQWDQYIRELWHKLVVDPTSGDQTASIG